MITVLKEGYWKIMQLFYKDKSEEFHLREIARQTKLHEPSVTRFLRSLEKEKILTSKKDGNLKKYKIKHNKTSHAIFSFFDTQKLERLISLSTYFRR